MIIAWLQNRMIVNPIKLLSKEANKIANGDFETKIHLAGNDEIGELASSFSHMRDNVKTYQQELHNKANYIEAVLENVFNAIITADEQGNILSFNKAAEHMFAYSSLEALGKNLSILMPENDAIQHDNYMHRYKETGKANIIGQGRDVVCIRKNGSAFPAHLAVSITEIDNRRVFSGVIRDISAEREAEKALETQQMLISTINQAQSMFIYHGDPVVLFSAILPDVMALTGSKNGLIGEALTNDKGDQYLRVYAAKDIPWDDDIDKLYDKYKDQDMAFSELDNLFGNVITNAEIIISNKPKPDPLSKELTVNDHSLDACLGIPLKVGERVIGMIGLANRDGGYDESVVEFLQPVLSTCSQLLDAIEKERKRKLQEEELQQAKQEAEAAVKA
ncbi:MAG: PAS domain S-box protein, partial [Gammaproteobacteria bacterium]|nr:PAS domain S-box protein [Gammaproteobacteria bacterium]